MDQLRRIKRRKPVKPKVTLASTLIQYREYTLVLKCLAASLNRPAHGTLPARLFANAVGARLSRYDCKLNRLLGDMGRAGAGKWFVNNKTPFATLRLAVDTFLPKVRPRGQLHRILEWAKQQLEVLVSGLDDHQSTGLFADAPPEHLLSYWGHPMGPLYADMNVLTQFLPFVVATIDTSPRDSTLYLYAEYLYEQSWAALLELAPSVADCVFEPGYIDLPLVATQHEVWSRLWDATSIAQAQASPDGAAAALIEDARRQLRILGDGVGEPNVNTWSTP